MQFLLIKTCSKTAQGFENYFFLKKGTWVRKRASIDHAQNHIQYFFLFFFCSNKEIHELANAAYYIKIAKVLIKLTNKCDILLPRLDYSVLFLAAATLASS